MSRPQPSPPAIARSPFPVGAVVRLKSGGPRMTVTGWIAAPPRVHVVCFVDRIGLVKADFAPECLVDWVPDRPRDPPAIPPELATINLDPDAPAPPQVAAFWRTITRLVRDQVGAAMMVERGRYRPGEPAE